jgi:peptide/nickel transport system ATP-binding protein
MAGTGRAHLRGDEMVLRAEDINVNFSLGDGKTVQAVSGVSFDIAKSETLSIVGESGCGKSSLGKALLQLPKPTSGSVILNNTNITDLSGEKLRQIRPQMQMIFQDPISSLDPRMTVRRIIEQPLLIWTDLDEQGRASRINELLDSVGMDAEVVGSRRPYEFSGGQCQRISIARALALNPSVLICDEPVSALDVSVQAQVLNLLQDMKDKFELTMMFISHDLGVVKTVSNRVMVMYLGKICEIADPETLYKHPRHHYTSALVASVPIADPTKKPALRTIQGEPPSPTDPPSGCRFRTRCPAATDLCTTEEPQLRELTAGQFVACHHPRD